MKAIIFLLFFVLSCTKDKPTKLYLTCGWDSFDTNKESFVIDLKKKTISWVNQNKEFTEVHMTDELISFSGIKDKVLLRDQTIHDVKLAFVILRRNLSFKVKMLSPDLTVDEISGIARDREIYTRGCMGDLNLKVQ